jgi:CheY-like chemotaxis protein
MKDPSQNVQVLIVDDNPVIRNLMCRGMEPHCAVISSSDGADALLKSVDNPPDLIISDFRMPGLDGRQLFEKLRGRENTRNIPFIFVASSGDIEEKLRPAVGDGVEMGQKTCRLTLRRNGEEAELYFNAGQCKHGHLGGTEGDTVAYQVIGWLDGEFEIEFGAISDRETVTLSTTGLLMEAMRLMDEANQSVES